MSRLTDEIKLLNKDVNNIATHERAKKLRKKLFAIGWPLTIIGAILFFTVIGFIVMTDPTGITLAIFIPLFFGSFIIVAIGGTCVSLAFKIVIVKYTTGLIDEVVGNNCPKCGDAIENDEMFCSKCGYQVKKECPKCKTINTHKDKFCKKCGEKLD